MYISTEKEDIPEGIILIMNETEYSSFDFNDGLPWLIFTLCDHVYAIHSKYVTGIITPPEVITPVPDSPETYRGVAEIRGEVFPVLDMRRLFNYTSLEQECVDFINMMDQREKEHLEWAEELRRCIDNDEDFKGAADPHKCKFGMWYDEYKKRAVNANYVLHKIERPHESLHNAAAQIAQARLLTDKAEKTRRINELMRLVFEEYVPEIRDIIDESKRRYRSFYRETVVLLKSESANLAIAVDKVLAVDRVSPVTGRGSMNAVLNSKFFIGVARNHRVDNDILIIDEEKLIARAEKEVVIEK